MTHELVHLNWSKFEDSALNTFRNLWTSGDFTDVTLACADGQQISAHKVILSSCSPAFKNLLLRNTHQHPLIYLKGIDFKYLESLVKFIYSGEVDIENDSLADFLDTADELQIAGLTKAVESDDTEANEEKALKKKDFSSICNKTLGLKMESHENIITPRNIIDLQVNNSNNRFRCDYCSFMSPFKETLSKHNKDHYRKMYSEMLKVNENISISETDNIAEITETRVIADRSISQAEPLSKGHFCDRCDIMETSGRALMKHRQEEHPGMDYYCKVCGKEFTRHNKLKVHRLAIHDEVKFPCESCYSSFTTKSNLVVHKKKYSHN